MNERIQPPRSATQAAEGLPRWRWTVEEMDRLMVAGVLTEDDRVELIGGELVPISPKGPLHEDVKSALIQWLRRKLPVDYDFVVELGWRPAADIYCEPDILVFPARRSPGKVPASDVLLAIEVADTSEAYDLGAKALVYAKLGVRECWVVSALSLSTRVHRDPTPEGYGSALDVPTPGALTPLLLPGLALSLAGLDIERET